MSKKLQKEILSWVIIMAVALLLAFIIGKVIFFRVKVPTESMKNTIMVGDTVVTLPLAYLFSDPERGDIVVFPYPDDESVNYIKRIIGLPGETIEGDNGLVYIDGEPLEESYVRETLNDDFGPYEIPKDSYFMMGDNRNESADSRYWEDKFLHKDKIKGKAFCKFPSFKKIK